MSWPYEHDGNDVATAAFLAREAEPPDVDPEDEPPDEALEEYLGMPRALRRRRGRWASRRGS